MRKIADMISAGHRLLEQGDPAEVWYDGKKYPCLSSEISRSRGDRRGGGQLPEISGSISIRKRVLKGKVISNGSRIRVDGVEYYVGTITEDSSTITIELETRNRK